MPEPFALFRRIWPLAALTCAAAVPAPPVPVPALPFAPRGYVCQRATTAPVVDGRLNDEVWAKAAWTEDFLDIEGPQKAKPRFRTRAKLAWDDTCLYVAAELEEPEVWAYQTVRDSVIFQDNDFEIFIDPDGSTSPYLEFEMNARNTVWDLMLLRPYRELGGGRVAVNGWDIHGLRTATMVQGTLNHGGDTDRGWTVEVAMPWAALNEASGRRPAPHSGDRWRINFSRVEWRTEIKDGAYVKQKDASHKDLPEDNWVWSPQGVVDMHCPEMWGFLQFSGEPAGTREPPCEPTPGDRAQWTLRQVYYAQRNTLARTGHYSNSLEALGDPRPPSGWTLRLEAGPGQWLAEVRESATGLRLRIDPLGRVETLQP